MTVGDQTRKEIFEQPEAWAQAVSSAAPIMELRTSKNAIYLGSGIVLYIARCVAALTQWSGGPTAYAVPAQDVYAFPGMVVTGHPTLYVMLARTGDVSDAVRGLAALRTAPGSRVAVIGEEGGPLAGLADRVIAIRVFEQSVVTTKTLTSMLLALQAGVWRGLEHPGRRALEPLPDVLSRLLPEYDAVARGEAARDHDEIVVLGSGPHHGLAEAGALTIREMSLSHAVAHHALVYPHGQQVTITEQTLVILFTSDSARDDERRVVRAVRANGGRSIAVGEGAGDLGADVAVEMASGLGEWERLALYHPFAQLLGYHRAISRGVDPDRPPHLPKVF